MDSENIKNAMRELVAFFKANLSDDAKYQYLKQLAHIPKDAMDDISLRIISERRPSSGNFPTIQEIKSAWYDWQRDNPQKVFKPAQRIIPCDSCGGMGYLVFKGMRPYIENDEKKRKFFYAHMAQFSAWCGDCENWKRHTNNIDGDRRYTKNFILDHGWFLWPFANWPKVDGGLKEMTGKIGKPFPKSTGYEDYSTPKWQQRMEFLREQAAELIEKEHQETKAKIEQLKQETESDIPF